MDSHWEWEFSEPSSKCTQVRYSHLNTNNLVKNMNPVHLSQATDNYQDSMGYIALMTNQTTGRKSKNSNQKFFPSVRLSSPIYIAARASRRGVMVASLSR